MKPKTNTEVQCFAHAHMTPDEYGVWNLCRELSYKSGVLLLDGRSMAQRFAGTSKSTIYRLVKALTKGEWFVLLEPLKRGASGQYLAARYKVLSHDEWTERHGCTQCSHQRVTSPVPKSASTCPEIEVHLSQNHVPPVPYLGHSMKEHNLNEHLSEKKHLQGRDPDAHTEPERDASADRQDGANSKTVSPVPSTGQVEPASVPQVSDLEEGWRPDPGLVPKDWIDHLRRPAIVDVPEESTRQ